MEVVKKQFSDIKHYELPEYFKEHNWEDTDFYEITYTHGETIANQNGFWELKNTLSIEKIIGIIVSGKAEIYETYIADKYKVYRPVKLIRPGDILGNFSVIDNICSVQDSRSRGERWTICAGFISILVTQKADSTHFKKKGTRYVPIEQHLITEKHISEKTKIVFFDAAKITKESHIFFQVLLYSWSNSKMYRDCLNSFNFSDLLDFRQMAGLIADDLLDMKNEDKKPIYDKEVGRTSFTHFFIDAVWDAYNRPIRGEPMFAKVKDEQLGEAAAAFKKINVSHENILVATVLDSCCDEFWFPIDINNYLIAANYDFTEKKFLDQDQVTHIQKKLENALKSIKKTNQNNSSIKSARAFYIDFCAKLLEFLAKFHPQYPFDVKCADVDGLENNILMLHFKKKQLVQNG
jgi:hypothetical protein